MKYSRSGFLLFEVLLSVVILSMGIIAAVQAFSYVVAIADRSASFFYATRVAEESYVTAMINDEIGVGSVHEIGQRGADYTAVLLRTEIEPPIEEVYDEAVQTPESAFMYMLNEMTLSKSKKPLWDLIFISRMQDVV